MISGRGSGRCWGAKSDQNGSFLEGKIDPDNFGRISVWRRATASSIGKTHRILKILLVRGVPQIDNSEVRSVQMSCQMQGLYEG